MYTNFITPAEGNYENVKVVRGSLSRLPGCSQRKNSPDLKRALTYTDTAPQRKKA